MNNVRAVVTAGCLAFLVACSGFSADAPSIVIVYGEVIAATPSTSR